MNAMTIFSRIFNSNAVECASYAPEAQELSVIVKGHIRKDGTRGPAKHYIYMEFPVEAWVRFCTAPSAGRFWAYQIVRNYPLAQG